MTLRVLFAVLTSLVAFLLPLGLYSLVLGYLNRGRRPVLVGGLWDTAALLFGLSGFFLHTVPSSIAEFYHRTLADSLRLDMSFDAFWAQWSLALLVYYAVLVAAALGLLARRRHTTAVYNVDVRLFGAAFDLTLDRLGLVAVARGAARVIAPAEAVVASDAVAVAPPPAPVDIAAAGERYAEVVVDCFPALCHVTLHWDSYAPALRSDFEAELARALEEAAPAENSAGGWLFALSGAILALLVLFAAFLVVLVVFSGRRL